MMINAKVITFNKIDSITIQSTFTTQTISTLASSLLFKVNLIGFDPMHIIYHRWQSLPFHIFKKFESSCPVHVSTRKLGFSENFNKTLWNLVQPANSFNSSKKWRRESVLWWISLLFRTQIYLQGLGWASCRYRFWFHCEFLNFQTDFPTNPAIRSISRLTLPQIQKSRACQRRQRREDIPVVWREVIFEKI